MGEMYFKHKPEDGMYSSVGYKTFEKNNDIYDIRKDGRVDLLLPKNTDGLENLLEEVNKVDDLIADYYLMETGLTKNHINVFYSTTKNSMQRYEQSKLIGLM